MELTPSQQARPRLALPEPQESKTMNTPAEQKEMIEEQKSVVQALEEGYLPEWADQMFGSRTARGMRKDALKANRRALERMYNGESTFNDYERLLG